MRFPAVMHVMIHVVVDHLVPQATILATQYLLWILHIELDVHLGVTCVQFGSSLSGWIGTMHRTMLV